MALVYLFGLSGKSSRHGLLGWAYLLNVLLLVAAALLYLKMQRGKAPQRNRNDRTMKRGANVRFVAVLQSAGQIIRWVWQRPVPRYLLMLGMLKAVFLMTYNLLPGYLVKLVGEEQADREYLLLRCVGVACGVIGAGLVYLWEPAHRLIRRNPLCGITALTVAAAVVQMVYPLFASLAVIYALYLSGWIIELVAEVETVTQLTEHEREGGGRVFALRVATLSAA